MRAGRAQQGFTLVELAIVLVIIGLIIGGVLVGRDMVASATIKAQVNQLDKYKTAVMVFKDKYRALPGDMPNATQFGLGGNGDGDGKLAPFQLGNTNYEQVNFWYHLATAGLIAENVTGYNGSNSFTSQANLDAALPPAKIGTYSYIIATGFQTSFYFTSPACCGSGASAEMGNGFFIATFSPTTCGGGAPRFGGGCVPTGGGLSPVQLSAIDIKMDDGKVFSGKVSCGMAFTGRAEFFGPSSSGCNWGLCDGAGPGGYLNSNSPSCSGAFGRQF